MTATALERIRQVLGNPDPRTLAEAVLRWCIQRVEKGEIVAVEGALRPAPVVPPTRP